MRLLPYFMDALSLMIIIGLAALAHSGSANGEHGTLIGTLLALAILHWLACFRWRSAVHRALKLTMVGRLRLNEALDANNGKGPSRFERSMMLGLQDDVEKRYSQVLGHRSLKKLEHISEDELSRLRGRSSGGWFTPMTGAYGGHAEASSGTGSVGGVSDGGCGGGFGGDCGGGAM